MCLASVKEAYDNPCPMITDGWKDLKDSKKPRVQFKVNGSYDLPLDTWITATDENAKGGVVADDRNKYEPGFHAYTDESELTRIKSRFSGTYVRVFLRNITCMGTQDGFKTVVAQEMYVPSDPNGWPPKGDEPVSGGGGEPRRSNPVKKFIDKTVADLKAKGVTPGQA